MADHANATLQLEGDISGNVPDPAMLGVWVPYVLRFQGVAAWKREDLDGSDWHTWASSLDEVQDSSWARAIGEPDLRHIAIQTYDDVFNVVCVGFTLELGEPYAA
ncbi:hypothetical protein ACFFGH_32300 [Lysobacter korlensis]|uniref:Integron-associated effector binding protein domain-containing protein n=1 Tax=Lysobacter korlensis TaxID=553636 RepID=A0ABV6RZX7_9GAMM